MNTNTPIKTNGGDWNEKFGASWKKQVDLIREKFNSAVEAVKMPLEYPTDVPILWIKKEAFLEVVHFLKTESGFEYDFLTDMTATDEIPKIPRFELVYNLFSTTKHWRVRLKVRISEGEEMPTLIPHWSGANWAEREIFDMFGIKFSGHPDLRRILMDERYVGHPLRKDFPLRGYQVFTEPEIANPEVLV